MASTQFTKPIRAPASVRDSEKLRAGGTGSEGSRGADGTGGVAGTQAEVLQAEGAARTEANGERGTT